jgi:hypothetical protein
LPAPLRIPRGVGNGLVTSDPENTDGGGVVSSELDELSFVEELPSLFDAPDDEAGGVVVGFIETNIEAASRSCTCWCLEMRSLDV